MVNQISSLEFSHFPVMLNEVLKVSLPKNGGKIIDCTFGGGGYSKEFLKIPGIYVEALDRDINVLPIAKDLQRKFPKRFKFNQIKFSQLDEILNENVDAVIFDLGLSSMQLDDLNRGFSFKSEKNLDMSMGLNNISAFDAINKLSEKDLKYVIKFLGEEKDAYKIAKNIVKSRNVKKITKTLDLVKIIEKSKKKII